DIIEPDATKRQEYMLSLVLKAIAGALDTHTAYFTPGEASQFMISVQQRLFGIGAQLRDDLNGLTVVRIIEGGPAERSGELKLKDRIIAVDAVPVVGMDITDAVELIRGDEGKAVRLTIIRDVGGEGKHQDEKMDVTVTRGEVVLNETRLESHVEPFADGVIAYLHLFSFYQDPESSSALDITRALHKIQEEHKIKGVVLDLRFNSGGMLSQAVAVTGLFITRGVVVSIKDDSGRVQHLRDLDGNVIFGGPMIVVANRASASAAEIVTQTLQDYGRAIVVGDDHTFGKGTFQTFTLNSQREENVNPQGEYKVTRGTYYTVSGKSPQKKGVPSDILVPGPLAKADIGEQFSDYALEGGAIAPLFDDELLDIPEAQRQRVAQLYRVNLQPILQRYTKFLPTLRTNAETRIAANKPYQSFLEKIGKEEVEKEELERFEG
ncbi:MAG: S41 family peptidase, partial [Chlamydiia bacterium]|nr:S41 family peptidase [Chlamydiia bacterium]